MILRAQETRLPRDGARLYSAWLPTPPTTLLITEIGWFLVWILAG